MHVPFPFLPYLGDRYYLLLVVEMICLTDIVNVLVALNVVERRVPNLKARKRAVQHLEGGGAGQ